MVQWTNKGVKVLNTLIQIYLGWKPWLVCSVCHRSEERRRKNHLLFSVLILVRTLNVNWTAREGKLLYTHQFTNYKQKSNQSILTLFSIKISFWHANCLFSSSFSLIRPTPHWTKRNVEKNMQLFRHSLSLGSVSHWFFCGWWFMKGKWSLFLHSYIFFRIQ